MELTIKKLLIFFMLHSSTLTGLDMKTIIEF